MFKAALAAAFLFISAPAYGPPDSMFEDLLVAPSDEEAEGIAMDIFASWLESGSPTVDILMERALVAQQHGDVKHARALFDRAILIQPQYAEAFHRRAALFLEEERYDEALRDLNAALEFEPRHFGAWMGLATIFERLGGSEEALAAYEEALEIYPRLEAARRARTRLRADTDGTSL